ncbi:hypothetical protein N9C35_02065 [Flavobacteriaceae bacterium]|nr:hypothetical protein [Flavobacteriaceae bacterium]
MLINKEYLIYGTSSIIAIIAIIYLIRAIFEIKIHIARDKKDAEIKKKKQKKFLKEEEVLFREKNAEQNVEIINKPQREQLSAKIVDIVKPVGFWTSMVLGQKLTHLVNSANLMNKDNRGGFWVSMVEAQDRAAGRQRGRSR